MDKRSIVQKIQRNRLIFCIAYVFFFFALYIEDVSISNVNTSSIKKILKIVVLVCLLVQVAIAIWKRKNLLHLFFALAIGCGIFLASGDFFWLIVLLMGSVAGDIDKETIYKISLKCMIVFTTTVLILFFAGISKDNLSHRIAFDTYSRHSLGFIHSNILPLAVFYSLVYVFLIYKRKTSKSVVVFWTFLSVIVYYFCGSRNAFIGSVLLILAYIFCKKSNKIIKKIIVKVSGSSMVLLSCISIMSSYFRYKGRFMTLWNFMDKIFTNRTLLGAVAVDGYGFHILNFMKSEEYFNTRIMVNSTWWDGVVLDNGYLYISVRYGIAVLVLCLVIYNAVHKQHSKSMIDCSALIIVALVNFTDNDLLSYGFLPMMVVGVQHLWNNVNDERDKIVAEKAAKD